jgi:hypothetical protein
MRIKHYSAIPSTPVLVVELLPFCKNVFCADLRLVKTHWAHPLHIKSQSFNHGVLTERIPMATHKPTNNKGYGSMDDSKQRDKKSARSSASKASGRKMNQAGAADKNLK